MKLPFHSPAGIVFAMIPAMCAPLEAQEVSPDTPWFVPVPGFKAPASGEHPRLMFRKADVPALRARAKTPEGQAIIARLRTVLGQNGEAFPVDLQTLATVNILPGNYQPLPEGSFTMSHGAGYGLLYQLTGDKNYAALARQSLEKLFAGQPDKDPRYAWVNPGTGFRLGAVFQGVALAYDLCYDGWDEEFRARVVREILDCKSPCLQHKKPLTLENMATANGYPPGSNHFGAYLGGTGMIVLAILGDPGADDARLQKVLAKVEDNLKVVLTRGFGDHGWFAEGTHPGRITSNTGIVPLLPCLLHAAGRDYLSPRPNGTWLTLRVAMELIPTAKGPVIPWRGDYGGALLYERPMTSHAGDFAQGMAAVPAQYRPALAWIHNHFLEPGSVKKEYNIESPIQAVMAFTAWPIGVPEKNPREVLPHGFLDSIARYVLFRNHWQDSDDIVVTALLGSGPQGYKRLGGGPIMVWGLGARREFPVKFTGGKVGTFETKADGGYFMVPGAKGDVAFGVDYSGKSGAAALLVMAGPAVGVLPEKKDAKDGVNWFQGGYEAGGLSYYVQMLAKGSELPTVAVEGDALKIGKATVRFAGGKLTFE